MSDDKEDDVKVSLGEAPFDPAEFDEKDPLSLDAADEVQTEIDLLTAERDDLKERLMRALADAENSRKRGERDRRDAEVYGGSKLARDLLSVYDNMSRALDTVDDAQRDTSKALIEGIELTLRELLNTFSKHKIERVAPEVGEKFDPQFHEAMFEIPTPDADNGTVMQVIETGYVIHDRLLRPAKVGIAKAIPGDSGPGDQIDTTA